MTKLFSRVLFVLIAIIIIPFQVNANEVKMQDQIKIGIQFGQSATPMVSLYSANGLELGYYDEYKFNSMINFFENDKIIIRKDSFFTNINGTFVEYNLDSQIGSYPTNIDGPIHIQIGNKFNSKQEATAFLESLPNLVDNPYLVYENGWGVWIGLYSNVSEAEEASQEIKRFISNNELKIVLKDDKRVQVLNKSGKVLFMYNVNSDVYAFKAITRDGDNGIIQLNDKKFRGSIIINRYTNSDMTVINQIDLEEYLYGVVPKEMSGNWPIEAQKAQAVAARSYVIVNLKKHKNYGFDLCSTSHCQVYGGYSSENPRTKIAVDQTKGKLLTYDGKVITASYHSNSGGHTEDSENVWSNPVGYLRGVDDPYSIGAPNDTWVKVYTKKEIEDVLSANNLSVGTLQNIVIEELSKNGRVLKLSFYGTSGKKVLEKGQIRSIFGYNNLKSTWFNMGQNGDEITSIAVLYDLSQPAEKINLTDKYILAADGLKKVQSENQYVSNGEECKFIALKTNVNININSNSDQYTFTGKGWGHGLGMSQWGAKKMAEEGFTYEQILTHYYMGTNIE